MVDERQEAANSSPSSEEQAFGCAHPSLLRFQAVHAHVPAMRKHILTHARSCGFSGGELDDIRIAVSEACTNAVKYGSPFGADNSVSVECRCESADFVVEICDEGVFQPMEPQLDPEMSMNGRGLLLMLSLMDKVTFDESPTGTRVRMTKRHPLLPLI